MAAHRFGLGEATLAVVGGDPVGWLLAQIGPADLQAGQPGAPALPDTLRALERHDDLVRQQRRARQSAPGSEPMASLATMTSTVGRIEGQFRALVLTDQRARLITAARTTRPFAERLAMFWANHFTVSMAKASVRGLVGSFERDVVRPHIAGRFETMLGLAVRHPAMLRYLDNDRSAGPDSRLARRGEARAVRAAGTAGLDEPAGPPGSIAAPSPRRFGLNENLARELLELHTLGVDGGYGQADVTQLAALLTGWRPGGFDPAWHQPGPKTVLGRRYEEGPEALDAVLGDLARHPSTARHVATRLARHVVADQPPPALVDRLADNFRHTGGDLAELARTLVHAPEAWTATSAKLKTPEEFVLSSARLLGWGAAAFERPADGGIAGLGQRPQAAPSPAGWPDRAAEWLGPDAVWKRVEWAHRVADRLAGGIAGGLDARALAAAALGPRLSDTTRREIERAADAPQALALLLLAPEFQRR